MDDSPDPLETLVRQEEAESMQTALTGLSQTDRRLLEQIYVRGHRVADIARRTGEPEARLRKRKSRALDRLRVMLQTNV